MQYVVIRRPTQQVDLFGTGDEDVSLTKTITHEQFQRITEYLKKKKCLTLGNSDILLCRIANWRGGRAFLERCESGGTAPDNQTKSEP